MQYPNFNPYFGAPPLKQQVTRVNGRNGAEAYQMAPDSSALLLDTTAPLVWLIQTDGAGYKTISPYTIAPYKTETSTLTSLETRIAKIQEEIKEYHDKQQSNSSNAGKYTITKPSK